jgi:HSP20 family protein
MPGLEPEDISVTVAGDKATIRGAVRGERSGEPDLLVEEWTVGPYYRQVHLPQAVNGVLTNATYCNGVLVLVMPKATPEQPAAAAEFQLEAIEPTRGERVGHTGQAMQPTSTAQHRQAKQQTTREAGGERDVHAP